MYSVLSVKREGVSVTHKRSAIAARDTEQSACKSNWVVDAGPKTTQGTKAVWRLKQTTQV